MSRALADRTVALAEGRQLEELASMFEAEGANVLRCPLISILDPPDEEAVIAWLTDLCADRFGWVVLMTGEGVRRLLAAAERAGFRDDVVRALGRTAVLTRGPKPGTALQEVGLRSARVAPAPTTEGIISALQKEPLQGVRIGVVLAGDLHPALQHFLARAGAVIQPVTAYVYAPAADNGNVADLIQQMSQGRIDVLLFTSTPQVDRLFDVAAVCGLQSTLEDGLRRTRLAAVGPVVAASLTRRGRPPDICPGQGFVMKNLVLQVKRALAPKPPNGSQ